MSAHVHTQAHMVAHQHHLLAYQQAAVLLLMSRDGIGDQPTRFSRATTFLHSEYRPMFFWWELMEMTRRLLLLGLFAMWPAPGSLAQPECLCISSVQLGRHTRTRLEKALKLAREP